MHILAPKAKWNFTWKGKSFSTGWVRTWNEIPSGV